MEAHAAHSHESPCGHTDLIAQLRAENESLQRELRRACLERDLFKEQLAARLRQLFAARSEKSDIRQSDLFFNEAEALCLAGDAAMAGEARVVVVPHARQKRGRKPLSADLPRTVIRHELPEGERRCAQDGSVLAEIGVEVSEQLDIVPASIRVIRHERVKYACPCCRQGVAIAPLPAKLVPKGLFTESALAHIVIAKYQDALPLYRQAVILKRCGGDIARHTLAANVIRVGEALTPLINLLREQLLEAEVIQGDETELQVLKEDGRPAQAKSWLWVQMTGTGPPVRLFTYASSRAGKTAIDLYAGARGALMSDGYEPYNTVAEIHQLTHLGCWVHARRRFVEAEAALPKERRAALHPATLMASASSVSSTPSRHKLKTATLQAAANCASATAGRSSSVSSSNSSCIATASPRSRRSAGPSTTSPLSGASSCAISMTVVTPSTTTPARIASGPSSSDGRTGSLPTPPRAPRPPPTSTRSSRPPRPTASSRTVTSCASSPTCRRPRPSKTSSACCPGIFVSPPKLDASAVTLQDWGLLIAYINLNARKIWMV